MPDFILVEGDKASFLPTFGMATVVVRPGALRGSGPGTLAGKKVCVDGDEGTVSVPGCPYTAPPYVVPGIGTLEIAAVAGDQKAKKTRTGGQPVLLKGSQFTASFGVDSPAQQPGPPPVPDPTPSYSGQGMFVTTNSKLRGT